MDWYPTAYYLCRQRLVETILKKLPKARFLEIGFGYGEFLLSLAMLNYKGTGIDLSQNVVELVRQRLSLMNRLGKVEVYKKDFRRLKEIFFFVFAFEVLEHQRDDILSLKKFYQLLQPGGYLLMSVPAHMKLWGANDDWAGHYRRYEKEELITKLRNCGFVVDKFCSIGVPICNLTKPFFDYFVGRSKFPLKEKGSKKQRTEYSGGCGFMPPFAFLMKLFINQITMMPFFLLQQFFLDTDYGVGFLVVAKK